MRLVVVGRSREVTGFALAGVETVVCAPADDASAVIDGLAAADAAVGLVIVTSSVGRAAFSEIQKLRRRKGPPVIAVLPDVSGETT